MRVLSILDSFKGTMSSKEAGMVVCEVLNNKGIKADYIVVADGGEGFLDSISNLIEYEKKEIVVNNPLGKKINSYYLIDKKANTAYIELALASGINLLSKKDLNPLFTSTYGVGELIKDAINNQVQRICLGIGGSCTNDGGTGLLEALGVKFYDKDNNLIEFMTGEKLGLIQDIDYHALEQYLHVEFYTLCDVTNPLVGPRGATYTFGPQKGATKTILQRLEKNMNHFVKIVKKYKTEEYSEISGTGAAGGVSFATVAFLNSKLQKGLDYILDLVNYESLIDNYDLIITGEGKIDYQSLSGKVPMGILERSKGKEVIALVGVNDLSEADINDLDNFKIFSIVPDFATVEESMKDPKRYLHELVESLTIL